MIAENAYAKINLTLDIVGRREDGYHLLETVMQTVSLCDRVSVERAEKTVIFCDDPSVPTDEKNTCHKAARLFFDHTGINGGAKIDISKNIPSQAGLGGGSADAAAVLRLLNRLYNAGLDEGELEKIAAEVGADVAFCIRGGTCVCRGIGENITPLESPESRDLLLVKPDFGISTPEAYKLFDSLGLKSIRGTEAFLKALSEGVSPYSAVSNDLEAAINNSVIQKIKQELLDSGAQAACMTGSGSCVFGIFSNKNAAESAKARFDGKYPFVCLCRTI